MSTTGQNTGWTKRWAMGVCAAGVLLACAGTLTAQTGTGGTTPATAKPQDLSKLEKRDLVIFKNGNKVEGVILEETESSVRFLVIVGTLRTPVSYAKSEILEIKRNEFKPSAAEGAEGKDEKKDEKKDAPAVKVDEGQLVDISGKPVAAGATKVYIMTFAGEFGRQVSKTPVKEVMEDILRVQPDVLIVRFEHGFPGQDGQAVDFAHQGYNGQVYGALETARELDTLITDRIRDDKAFVVKPRKIAWINRALGGGAFYPFTFPEIYFTPDGFHGGIGGLDLLFQNVGDVVAQRKQQSLRLARAIGLAEQGGHDGRIMRAMTWTTYVLSYRIVGGKAEFLEDKTPPGPEWLVLKDDGLSNADNADSLADRVRMKGNDLLTLDARTAFDIGFSKGTASSVEDILSSIGVTRNYAIVKNNSKKIFSDWSKDLNKAEQDALRLIRQFQAVEVRPPGGFKERTAARTQQINILRQLQSVVERYIEAISAERLGAPEDLLTQTHLVINRIQTAQKLDRP
ncbi:MAG: hypothetical protein K2W85_10350 [Phycisphaerales bacterium]|nr:hypothetical protein [Phycisphaerales bacterium]